MSWTAAWWPISINSLTFISLPLLTPTTTPATHTSRHKWVVTGQRSCWWKLPGPPGFTVVQISLMCVCITSAFRDKPEKYFTLVWYRKQVENRFLRHCKRLFYCDTSCGVVMVLNSYSVISEVLTVHLNLWSREYVCAVWVIRQNALLYPPWHTVPFWSQLEQLEHPSISSIFWIIQEFHKEEKCF